LDVKLTSARFAFMQRPDPGEHSPYYSTYIDRVPERPVLEVLAEAPAALEVLLAGVSEAQQSYAYEEGKWSIRQVLGHVVDTERVFSYRALHMARADPAPLPGMDQEAWNAGSNAEARSLSSLLAEFRALRAANVELFASFDAEILDRRGVASEMDFTVRALVYIVAGHELHHHLILSQRYLPGLQEGSDA